MRHLKARGDTDGSEPSRNLIRAYLKYIYTKAYNRKTQGVLAVSLLQRESRHCLLASLQPDSTTSGKRPAMHAGVLKLAATMSEGGFFRSVCMHAPVYIMSLTHGTDCTLAALVRCPGCPRLCWLYVARPIATSDQSPSMQLCCLMSSDVG